MSLFIESTLRFSVLIVIVLALSLLWRSSAARRHLAWTIAAASGVVITVLTVFEVSLALPVPWLEAPSHFPVLAPDDAGSVTAAAPGAPAKLDPFAILWVAGAALLICWTLLGFLLSSRLAAAGKPVDRAVPREAGDLRVRTSSRVTMPISVGLVRSTILLPDEALSWPDEPWRATILHEAAHARRGDIRAQFLGALARALHWPNPLAWLALSRIRREAETAADDAVLASGVEPAYYAQMLLDTSRKFHGVPLLSAPMSSGEVSRRVIGVLGKRRRPPPTKGQSIAGALFCLLLIVPLASVRCVPAEREPSAAQGAESPEQDRIGLSVGEELGLTFSGLSRVAIADPNIADVRVDRGGRLMLNGLRPGTTSLMVWYANDQRRSLLVTVRESTGVEVLGEHIMPSSVYKVRARVGDSFARRFEDISRVSVMNSSILEVETSRPGAIDMRALARGESVVLVWRGGSDPEEAIFVEID